MLQQRQLHCLHQQRCRPPALSRRRSGNTRARLQQGALVPQGERQSKSGPLTRCRPAACAGQCRGLQTEAQHPKQQLPLHLVRYDCYLVYLSRHRYRPPYPLRASRQLTCSASYYWSCCLQGLSSQKLQTPNH